MLTLSRLAREFSGNDELLTQCANLLTSGRFSHAVIIEGDDGLGKSTFARLLAKGLLCDRECPPCGECAHCVKISKGIHPDLTIVSGEGKSGSISVDSIRAIRADAYTPPNEAVRKVYIIEDCEKLPVASQNTLLKVFEEPPSGAVFILTCRSKMSLLTTILSRARVFSLLPVTDAEAIERVAEIRSDIPRESIESAVRSSGGNIGIALSLIAPDGSFTASLWEIKAREIALALCDSSEQALLSVCNALGSERQFVLRVLDSLQLIVLNALELSVGSKANASAEASALSKTVSLERLYSIRGEIDELKSGINANVGMRGLFPCVMCAKLRRAAGK